MGIRSKLEFLVEQFEKDIADLVSLDSLDYYEDSTNFLGYVKDLQIELAEWTKRITFPDEVDFHKFDIKYLNYINDLHKLNLTEVHLPVIQAYANRIKEDVSLNLEDFENDLVEFCILLDEV